MATRTDPAHNLPHLEKCLCGSEDLDIEIDEDRRLGWIACRSCGLYGPTLPPSETVANWNSLLASKPRKSPQKNSLENSLLDWLTAQFIPAKLDYKDGDITAWILPANIMLPHRAKTPLEAVRLAQLERTSRSTSD